MYRHNVPSFFLTNSTRALQRDLDEHIMPVFIFSSKNSCKVPSSSADREYIGPRGGILSPSICMAKL